MKMKMEQFPAKNPNPVLRAEKDGTVLYSNVAGEPLLHEWGVEVGEKLPSYIVEFVKRVISQNSPKKMEVNVGKRVYLVAFHPISEEDCVNIYGFDISDQKELEEKYHNIVEKSMPCQVLLDENHALRDEIQRLRACLEEPEELRRAISEGDLDALVMPVSEEDIMVFTLSSADQAYRTLMETANEDVLIVDAEFKVTYAGKRLIDKLGLGYSQEEIIGRSWLDFVDEESKVYSDLRMKKRRQGSDENYELKLICQDGSPLWILASSNPLFDENGKFRGALAMLTDITERKRIEETLRKSEAQLREAQRLSKVGDWEWVIEGDIVTWSDELYNIAGLSKERPAPSYQEQTNLYARESWSLLDKAVENALETGEPYELMLELIRVDGTHRWVNAHGETMRDLSGLIVGLRGTVQDLTERKQTEEKLAAAYSQIQSIIDNTPDIIYAFDLEERFVLANKAVANVLNSTPDRMIGKRRHEFMPKMDADWHEANDRQVFEAGRVLEFEEYSHLEGRSITWLTKKFPLRDAQERIYAVAGISADITERKRREEIQEAINSINRTIHSTLDFDDIMQKTVSEASKAIGSDTAAVSLRKGDRWIISHVYGFPESVIGNEMNDEEEPHALLAIKTRKPVAINNAFNDERVNRNHMKKWGIRSVLVVPLVAKDEVIGVIFFNCYKSVSEFGDIQVDFATRLASSISLALENSRLFENLKIELTERKKADSELRKMYEKLQSQSEELQVFNEELQVQSEELHEANEALHESEKRYRTLAENSPDIVIRFDRQNRYMYANPAASEAYGFSQEEIIGKTQDELGMNPELVKFLETYQEIVFTTGKPETMEFQYKFPQGKERYFNTKIVPEFANGKVTSILAISHDITDIKESEAKLREALDNLEELVKERTAELEKAYISLKEGERGLAEAQEMAHLGNWVHNIITDEIRWSDEAYRIFGFKPQEFGVTYDGFLSYVHTDDRDFVVNAVRQTLNGKVLDIEHRIVLANGGERIVHERGEVVFDDKNNPVLRGIVQDITERKKAEESLANIEIARKQEIHHRIKNNLQVISSLLDLQAEQFRNRENIKDSEVLGAFRESQDRVISMALIHEELYKGGGFDTLDFSPYIEELAHNLFLTYRLGNIDISLNMDLEENLFFDMDTAVPLGMIVNELISNSLKHAFIGRDKGEIRIKLHKGRAYRT